MALKMKALATYKETLGRSKKNHLLRYKKIVPPK
jgi:hypothetical protein